MASSLTAPVLALVAALALTLLVSDKPALAFKSFFIQPWSSAWHIGNLLDRMVLLISAGLGAAIAFKAGVFNLGGEGQIYLGGFASSLILLVAPNLPPALLWIAAALTAIAAGAFLGGLAGYLKAAFGVNELITSFLLTLSVSPAVDYLIAGPLRDQSGSLLALPRFLPQYLLPSLLPPSHFNISALAALCLILGSAFFLERSRPGFSLRAAGANANFARFAGIKVEKIWTPAMAVSGALHGLSGFFAVAGTYGLCHRGFTGGLGWSALAVALIARNAPLALIPAALLYAFLEAGSEAAHLSEGLPFETTTLLQAIVFLLVSARFIPRFRLGAIQTYKRRGAPKRRIKI